MRNDDLMHAGEANAVIDEEGKVTGSILMQDIFKAGIVR